MDGRPVVYVDALGRRTTSQYDVVGRPIATQDTLGYLWTTTYDNAGQ